MIVVAKPKLGSGLDFIEIAPEELERMTPEVLAQKGYLTTVEEVTKILTPFTPYPTEVAELFKRHATMPVDTFVDWLMVSPSAVKLRETVLLLDFEGGMPNPFKVIAIRHLVSAKDNG